MTRRAAKEKAAEPRFTLYQGYVRPVITLQEKPADFDKADKYKHFKWCSFHGATSEGATHTDKECTILANERAMIKGIDVDKLPFFERMRKHVSRAAQRKKYENHKSAELRKRSDKLYHNHH